MRTSKPIDLRFPIKGLDEHWGHNAQPEGTSVDLQNVRAYDPLTGRARGAQRAGQSKYLSAQVPGSATRIQEICTIVSVQSASPSQASMQIRSTTSIAVGVGKVVKFTSSGITAVTNGTGAFSSSVPVIFAAPFFGDIFFADGFNYKFYDVSANTVSAWSASAGSLPANGSNYPRLIEVYRGRLVLSGISTDPQNWFMSAVGDATDFDYAPDPEVASQAVAANNSPAGLIGEPVTGMVPFSEDLLLFGADHSLWMLAGDPMAGGQIDRISDATGMAWGRAWCKDPNGVVYFFGSRGGVYRMSPGGGIERITGRSIENRLANVNLNTHIVRMIWDDRTIGVHLFITPLTTGSATHYFYDARNESWFKDVFANNNHNPAAVHVLDGDAPGDRVVLLGGQDGYIRKIDYDADDDDGTAIASYVVLGPIADDQGRDLILQEIYGIFGSGSNDVTCEVFTGSSPEAAKAALGSTASYSVTLSAVRSGAFNPRIRGNAFYLKLSNTANNEDWALESLNVKVAIVESSRGRRAS